MTQSFSQDNHILYQSTMEEFARRLSSIVSPYKARFEECIALRQEQGQYGDVDELKKASLYALSSGGKRFRPAIVWMVAQALGLEKPDDAALAVEYFHTASLIADDLPCMDNDDFRRGVPTTHKAFSEATALLACLSLIALGFQSIAQAPLPQGASSDLYQKAILEASRTMGALGLIGGQAIDLTPPDDSLSTIEAIIDMKTGALFELSFVLGWIFGGGDTNSLNKVHELARNFGRAFQILDDLDDLEKDLKSGKTINYALRFGASKAVQAIHEYVDRAKELMTTLGLYTSTTESSKPLIELTELLSFAAQGFASSANCGK